MFCTNTFAWIRHLELEEWIYLRHRGPKVIKPCCSCPHYGRSPLEETCGSSRVLKLGYAWPRLTSRGRSLNIVRLSWKIDKRVAALHTLSWRYLQVSVHIVVKIKVCFVFVWKLGLPSWFIHHQARGSVGRAQGSVYPSFWVQTRPFPQSILHTFHLLLAVWTLKS